MRFIVAKDLSAIAKAFDSRADQALLEARCNKSFARRRQEGEAYAWEQAARMLREVKWAHDVEQLGSKAPYAISKEKPNADNPD